MTQRISFADPAPDGPAPFRRIQVCWECGRHFDLADEQDAAEFAYGHDCEG